MTIMLFRYLFTIEYDLGFLGRPVVYLPIHLASRTAGRVADAIYILNDALMTSRSRFRFGLVIRPAELD